MRYILPVLLLVIALSGAALADGPTQYGEELTEIETISMAELFADPATWVGKRIKVEGRITEVCPKAGCWVDITEGDRKVRFKVKDGVIIFETDTVGRDIVAEGVFTSSELDRDQAIAYARHEAEERGVDFDPASVTGPMTVYRIDGRAAVVR